MRNFGLLLLFGWFVLGCDDPVANETPRTAESAKTEVETEPREAVSPSEQPSAKPVPKLPEKDRTEKPVGEMSDQELEVACFEGRREACDLLGH